MNKRIKRQLSSRTQYDDDYPTCERTVAYFRIYGDALDPAEVTRSLGIQPTMMQRAGQVFTSSMGRQRTAKQGNWILSSEHHVNSRDLRRHLDWLLGVLVPRIDTIRALRSTMSFRMDVNCVWWSKYGDGGPVFWPEQMRAMADLDLEMGLDVSFFGEEEE